MQNLDVLCAETGLQIAKHGADEKALNAAIAVLEEQGAYAMFLYLKVRHKDAFESIRKPCLELLQKVLKCENQDILKMVMELSKDLDRLLFTRDLLRSTLAYARYHVKAKT